MSATRKYGRRTCAAALLVTVGVAQLLGCAPEPQPTPTPTAAFASEDEAFAAAEEVYRAYNEALNQRRDGTENADPQQYLAGIALEDDINGQNSLEANGLRIEGDAEVTAFTGESGDLRTDDARIVGLVCIDVSEVALLNDRDADVTPSERGDTVAQRVVFVGSRESLAISQESMAETTTC